MDALRPYARTAFAHGWAVSGGPMTERVRAASATAVTLACEDPHDPLVLEKMLRLGHLEGTWALIYQRRQALLDAGTGAIRARLRAMLDLPGIVRAFRTRHGLTETAQPSEPAAAAVTARTARRRRRDLTVVQDAATLVDRHLDRTELPEVVQVLLGFLADAHAEGQVGALALAADENGQVGFDFDLAFDDALTALRDEFTLGTGWADAASGWLQDTIGDSSRAIGRALADQLEAGGSYQDMLDAVGTVLDDSSSVALATDLALSTALTQGALGLYASEGVAQVEYVSAGDSRVCAQCEEAEVRGPYSLADSPQPPLHPFCRCCLQATDPTSLADQAAAYSLDEN